MIREHQRGKADCALACLSMILGVKYTALAIMFPYAKEIGVSTQEVLSVISAHNKTFKYFPTKSGLSDLDPQFGGARMGYDQEDIRGEIGKKKAIVVVRGKSETGYHAVAMRGGMVYDPSPSTPAPYRLDHRTEIIEAIILV